MYAEFHVRNLCICPFSILSRYLLGYPYREMPSKAILSSTICSKPTHLFNLHYNSSIFQISSSLNFWSQQYLSSLSPSCSWPSWIIKKVQLYKIAIGLCVVKIFAPGRLQWSLVHYSSILSFITIKGIINQYDFYKIRSICPNLICSNGKVLLLFYAIFTFR